MLRDLRSNVASDLGFYAEIVSDTTTAGQVVDTAHYESGLMFSIAAVAWTDGVYTPLIEEADNEAMTGATEVPDKNLIGTEADAAVDALTDVADPMKTIGVATSERYVRISMVSSGTTDGATIAVMTNKMPELKPVA